METLQAILLAIIQGLTEFLPISSSAHLILLSELSGWKDQGLVFDVALHFGTLLAVIFYFRDDLLNMFCPAHFKSIDVLIHSQLGIILVATIPVVFWWIVQPVDRAELEISDDYCHLNGFLWFAIIFNRL
jgi:undecaprenyl-diphosphatase